MDLPRRVYSSLNLIKPNVTNPDMTLRLRALLPLAGLLLLLSPAAQASVVINEFMSSNGTTLADEDGASEDWIELHNTGGEAVDLSDWGLSDNAGNPFKWRFPAGTTIGAGGHLLVWASGKDREPGEVLPGIVREVWTGMPGLQVSVLTSHPDYPHNPASRNRITDFFEAPQNIADHYGQRMHGILTAPDTGNYRFWIASDDHSQLLLSTDENPDNAVPIASVNGAVGYCSWGNDNNSNPQRSAQIWLEAGERRYIAAIMKEHTGGDHLTVRWTLPGGAIEEPMPAYHILSPATGQLHTNFRISSAGEPLLLTNPEGQTVDFVPPAYAPRDVSYGRQPDGGAVWHYFSEATPGAANTSSPVEMPPAVTIGEPRGFKTEPFHVTLAADPPAPIHYTLDGSEPGPSSPLYTAPIQITGTTTLRASAASPGMIQLPPETATYLFLDDILQQGSSPPPGWPADREINNHRMDYGMRPEIVTGDNARLREGMAAIPSISLVTDLGNLFDPATGIYSNSNNNQDWERPVSVELIDPAGNASAEFQIDAGLRLRGAFSRSVDNPKHSLRLLFRSAYGEKQLNYPLFDDEGPAEYQKVDLRTAQNYSWAFQNDNKNTFLRDVFSRDSQRDMGMPYTRSRYYHLYLNGQYWGLYMTQERGDADWATTYLGGDSDDWDTIKTNRQRQIEPSDGNVTAFYDLHEIAVNQGFTGANADNYWRVRGLNPDGTPNPAYPVYVDQDNLINYMLVTHYTGDPDSPISAWGGFPNNMYGLFNRNDPGGFKWLRHDAEHSLGVHGDYGVNADTTAIGTNLTSRTQFNPSILHWQLAQHPEYRMRVADLFHKHLLGSGALTPENAKARVQSRMAEIDLAIIGESARWGRGRTRDATWLPACNTLLGYLDQRRDIVVSQYRNRGWYPSIDAPLAAISGEFTHISSETPFYYMTDGSDPRLPGGGIRPGAQLADTSSGGGPVPLVGRGSVWRYFDAGSEPPASGGLTWRDPDYPDASWSSGPAVLGFAGASPQPPIATTTKRYVTGTSGPQVTTTYLRHEFTLGSPGDITGLAMEILRDDGVVVYLNGVEILRENMPGGTITYDTWASSIVGGNDQTTYFARLSDAVHLLRPGVNVLAVSLHQVNATSSDLSFDFSLTGTALPYSVTLPIHQTVFFNARAYHNGEWSALTEFSSLSELPDGDVIHQWNFEDPGAFPGPSFTMGGGTLAFTPGASTEVVRHPEAAQDFGSAHLRINNPLGTTLEFAVPTTGYQHIGIGYQTRRSGQGAGVQTIEYTTDGVSWTLLKSYDVLDAAPQEQSFVLAPFEAVNHNPHFAVRLTFSQAGGGTAGNNRFDNVTVTGMRLPDINLPPVLTDALPNRLDAIESGTTATFPIADWFSDPDDDPLVFSAVATAPATATAVVLDGQLAVTGLQRGETEILLTADDGENPPVEAVVRVLVHPAPHVLASGSYAFGEWDASTPAGVYPPHMIFLQGAANDSTLATELDRAYHIPAADAVAPADADFPYAATNRTRINGLGGDGIAFINTGRGRDLGGALLALDTTGLEDARVGFTAGTVLPNFRNYAIRLQYRLGIDGPFTDLLDALGQPVEYVRDEVAGHEAVIEPVDLPPALLDQPYVQLMWRYHHLGVTDGSRAQLRLDDILVATGAEPAGYALWRHLHFDPADLENEAVSGPQASAAGDGIANLLRYAHGVGPWDPVADLLPRLGELPGDEPAFRFLYDPDLTGLAWVVRSSPDLQDWSTVVFDSRTDTPPPPGPDGWTALPVPAGESRLFLHLELLLIEP